MDEDGYAERRELLLADSAEFIGKALEPVVNPSSTRWKVALGETPDGSHIPLPVGLVRGSGRGPRVWMQAGLHGDETIGMVAAHRILVSALPQLVLGTLVVVPIVNVLAFRSHSRNSPVDGQDGNRVWGTAALRATEQRAHTLSYLGAYWTMINSFAPDVVIDLHDGGPSFDVASHSAYIAGSDEVAAQARNLSRTSGMPYVLAADAANGTTFDHHLRLVGRVSLTLESGSSAAPAEASVVRLRESAHCVLTACGSFQGVTTSSPPTPIEFTQTAWARSSRAGFLNLLVRIGDNVREGQVVAKVLDIFGLIVEEVLSPVEGLVFAVRTCAVVDTGDQIVKLAA